MPSVPSAQTPSALATEKQVASNELVGEQVVSKPEPHRRYFNGTFKAFWDNLKQLPNGTFSKFSFGRVSQKVRDFLKEKGINTTDDYNHTIDNSGISHMEKQHGNKQKEEKRGQ